MTIKDTSDEEWFINPAQIIAFEKFRAGHWIIHLTNNQSNRIRISHEEFTRIKPIVTDYWYK